MVYDFALYNVKLVHVGLLNVSSGWIAVKDGRIAQIGGDDCEIAPHAKKVDGKGHYVLPSLIDVHMHIESSFVTPRRFVEAALSAGTGTVLADPHEIANVAGVQGVEWMVEASKDLPMDIYFCLPSCVPATNSTLESSGASFGVEELRYLHSRYPGRFLALGEVMDFTDLSQPDSRLKPILKWAKGENLIIDGHCPVSLPKALQDYFSHGIMADHTLMEPEKIANELSLGIWVQLQEKSITQENIDFLGKVPLEQILFATDDYPPSHFAHGHLNSVLRKAVALGFDPLQAIASATIRSARFLGLWDVGVLAPGRWANFWLTDDLHELKPQQVYYRGQNVCELLKNSSPEPSANNLSRHYLPTIKPEDLKIRIGNLVPAIVSNGQNTLTGLEWVDWQGHPLYDPIPAGYSWCMSVARHKQEKEIGLCLLKDFGPSRGAIASTAAHDSHNLVAVGNFPDLLQVVKAVKELGGGLVAIADQETVGAVPLEVAGLMSSKPVWDMSEAMQEFELSMKDLGVNHVRALVFLIMLSLTVSPNYKLTTKGVIDVKARQVVWHHQNEF